MNRAEDNSRSGNGMTLNNRRIAPRIFLILLRPVQLLLQNLRRAGLLNYCDVYCIYNNDLEGTAMLKTPELAMPRTRKVTTVCNGRREVWTDYEQAKAYFLELMMSTDGEEHDRAECVFIQLLHGLSECLDEEE